MRAQVRRLAVSLTLAALLTQPVTSAHSAESDERLARAHARLGQTLARALLDREGGRGNLVISPVGASSALGPLYLGANRDTRGTLRDLIGLGPPEVAGAGEELRPLADLCRRLAQGGDEISWAAALWFDDAAEPYPAIPLAVRQMFGAPSSVTDLGAPEAAAMINRWAEENTGGVIKRVVDRLPRDATMVVASALRFKASWATRFDPTQTKSGPFAAAPAVRQASYMAREAEAIAYREDAGLRAVDMPFAGGRYSLVALLPPAARGRDGASSLSDALKRDDLADWLMASGFRPAPGRIELPKFTLSSSNDLLPALGQAVGPAGAPIQAQRPGARERPRAGPGAAASLRLAFPGLAEAASAVSQIQQAATMTVDESGAEAAAATAVVTSRSAAQPQSFELRFDRPFLVALREVESNVVLFLALVQEPGV